MVEYCNFMWYNLRMTPPGQQYWSLFADEKTEPQEGGDSANTARTGRTGSQSPYSFHMASLGSCNDTADSPVVDGSFGLFFQQQGRVSLHHPRSPPFRVGWPRAYCMPCGRPLAGNRTSLPVKKIGLKIISPKYTFL